MQISTTSHLCLATVMDVLYQHITDPSELRNYPVFPTGTTSALARYLTPELWHKFRDEKDAAGVTFKRCIFSGIENVDSEIGIYAGSSDSYAKFAPLFEPIIQEYHKYGPADKQLSCMDASVLPIPEFLPNEESMILSTRIRVARNIAKYPFGAGITKQQRLDLMDEVSAICDKLPGELKGDFYPLVHMTKDVQNQLIQDHFLFKEGDRFLESAGLNRDWPSGRAIFFNKEKTVLVWVNEEDHLRIISMQKGGNIKEVYVRLCKLVSAIERELTMARNDHLGILCSCPTNLGTGLRASVHVKLPNLAKNMETFKKIVAENDLHIRGIHGEHSESEDSVYDISNRLRLGRSENDLVMDLYKGVKVLIKNEMQLSEH